jgi:sialic acid synthase SpsE
MAKYQPDRQIFVGERKIALDQPTYFIADVAANHDGDLKRAKKLIAMAAEAGADAVKFQHFAAETIVSNYGFTSLGNQQSHQASWKKSVFEVYQDASVNVDWTPELKESCDDAGVTFFTSPYSFDLVDAIDQYVPAFKIGSGDITWHDIIRHMSQKGKPVMLATGASTMSEVQDAVAVILQETPSMALLQCNTNYTASVENFRNIQLHVLKSYAVMYPNMILGLSDHTLGHATVLGAVALGARIIEKHFTDDRDRVGPDHNFSTDPTGWREMVDRTRELELALGAGVKKVEDNEHETVILQRRSIRALRKISRGSEICEKDLIMLRPCPEDGLPPYLMPQILEKKALRDIEEGEHLRWIDLG